MSLSLSFPQKGMSEGLVLQLADLGSKCTLKPSEDVLAKLRAIQTATTKPETTDNQLGWRRGTQHSQGRSGEWSSGPYRSNGHGHYSHHRSASSSQQNQQQNQGPHQRYVSKFRCNDTPVEERILNQVILNKLNKFSEVNYEEVKQFLKQILDNDDVSFLKEFMQLVFRKAASEQVFCPLYARLICELSAGYKSLEKEFEVLYKDYLNIFEDISESKCPDYETFIKRNRERMYRLGYSQFLAELISLGVLKPDDLVDLYSKILEQISNVARESKEKTATVDEYIQCILRMTRALKTNVMIQTLQCFEEPIEYLVQNQATEFPGLSKKSVFGLMDCLDILRKNV